MPERNQGNFPAEIRPERLRGGNIVANFLTDGDTPLIENRMRHFYKSVAFLSASSFAIVTLGTTNLVINAAYVGLTSGIGAAIDIYVDNKYFREE